MAYADLPMPKKNSVKTTIAAPGIDASTGTIPVAELSVFYDKNGDLITEGICIGFLNSNQSIPEEITITGASGTSGPGNLTGATRGVNADGSIGAGHAWDTGTEIAVVFSTGVYLQIKDNLAAHQTILATNLAAHQTILATMPNRNAIINGDCRVNQRVTAYTLVKDAYTWDSDDLTGPDRHEGMATGTAVSAGTWEQTLTATAGSSGYAFKFAGVTLTGTGILYHRYRMEAKDAVRFKNQTASFSASVHQDTGSAINYTVYIRKADASNNFSAVTAISDSGAISVPSATKTALKYENISMGDCSNGIEIEIKIECGAVTTKNFEQTELQLELGSVATAFEVLAISIEQTRCGRYVNKSYSSDVAPGTATKVGYVGDLFGSPTNGNVNTYLGKQLRFPIRMRSAPSVIIYDLAGTASKVSGHSQSGVPSNNHSYAGIDGLGETGFCVYTYNLQLCNIEFQYLAVSEL